MFWRSSLWQKLVSTRNRSQRAVLIAKGRARSYYEGSRDGHGCLEVGGRRVGRTENGNDEEKG